MKINPITKKNLIAVAIGLSGPTIGIPLMNAELSHQENLDNCKKEILTKDPQRFLRLSKSVLDGNRVNWINEASTMNDSLDNIQRSYFEGAQLIQENKDRK